MHLVNATVWRKNAIRGFGSLMRVWWEWLVGCFEVFCLCVYTFVHVLCGNSSFTFSLRIYTYNIYIYIIYNIYIHIYILYTSVIYMILSLQPTFVSDRAIPKPWRSCRPGSTSQSSLPDGSAWPSSPCQRTTWAMAVVGKSTEAVKNYGFWTW